MTPTLQPYLARFDFDAIGRVLADGIDECVQNVAQTYSNEYFGFALDCHVSVGTIHFSFGTLSHLERVASRKGLSRSQALESPELVERVWSLGDWPIYCIDERLAPKFFEAWKPWEALIEHVGYREIYEPTDDDELLEAYREYILSFAATVLCRAEASGVFAPLSRIEGFRTIVLDHDEDIVRGLERVDRCKRT